MVSKAGQTALLLLLLPSCRAAAAGGAAGAGAPTGQQARSTARTFVAAATFGVAARAGLGLVTRRPPAATPAAATRRAALALAEPAIAAAAAAAAATTAAAGARRAVASQLAATAVRARCSCSQHSRGASTALPPLAEGAVRRTAPAGAAAAAPLEECAGGSIFRRCSWSSRLLQLALCSASPSGAHLSLLRHSSPLLAGLPSRQQRVRSRSWSAARTSFVS